MHEVVKLRRYQRLRNPRNGFLFHSNQVFFVIENLQGFFEDLHRKNVVWWLCSQHDVWRSYIFQCITQISPGNEHLLLINSEIRRKKNTWDGFWHPVNNGIFSISTGWLLDFWSINRRVSWVSINSLASWKPVNRAISDGAMVGGVWRTQSLQSCSWYKVGPTNQWKKSGGVITSRGPYKVGP